MNRKWLFSPVLLAPMLIALILVLGYKSDIQAKNITPNPGKMTIEERISNSQSGLEKIKSRSDDVSIALVSFAKPQKASYIKELLKSTNLNVETIYHFYKAKNNTFRGAYFKPVDEALEVSLTNQEEQVKAYTSQQTKKIELKLKELEPVAANATGDKAAEEKKALNALKNLQADANEFRLSLLNEGLNIYGLKISAKNKDLQKLIENSSIKLVEEVTPCMSKWSPIIPQAEVNN